jgi:hypothetical protein
MFSSNLSRMRRTSLHWLICIFSFERSKAHLFNTLLRSLNFAASLVALLEANTSVCHADWTMSKNPGMSAQKLSNLKTLAFWYRSPHLNQTRHMIRSGPSQGEQKSVWVDGDLIKRSKAPIQLFQKGVLLHIALCIAPTLEGNFLKI